MNELSEDLLLLAVRGDGTLALPARLRFGLAGAELVRLAAAGRVDIVKKRIVVLDPGPAGDALLDEALASMSRKLREPTAESWVARNRPGLVDRYLIRAQDAGTVLAERGTRMGLFPVTRWRVMDTGRAAQARARLEAVAASTGAVRPSQAALAGLATAIGADLPVFPGRAGMAARRRLRAAAKSEPSAAGVTRAVSSAGDAATHSAISASTQAAVNAALAASAAAAAAAAAGSG